MEPNQKYGVLPSDEVVNKVALALENNGIKTFIVRDAAEAEKKLLELIPPGAEVMNMTSMTLEAIGAVKEITESGRYDSVRKKFMSMDAKTDGKKMKMMGAAPDWAVGSANAVTEDGRIISVSATGSQLPAYAYGAGNVIWVVGAQKFVKDLNEGMDRIQEYVFPLENERAKKTYGRESSINKILIVNKDVPSRTTMIIVREKLGF
ncbi:MAG: LUD domain-containing protein [Minisyncoccia bacterium]|jgi:hypothetical protein